ncbi:MAG TPA: DUF1287 domain-containing protein [Candidatus Acidoferrum sp.]|jgi:hypothetical protein
MTAFPNAISRSRSLGSRLFLLILVLSLAVVCHALQTVSPLTAPQQQFLNRFAASAVDRTHHSVRYDPAYVRIPYPGGDVPASTGVCTDEVIRAYRSVGIDLQKEVHEDMASHTSAYPRKWNSSSRPSNASATDTNIDHRRVPNLMVFFARHGQALPLSTEARDYHPGEIVAWNLGGGITHIGIVVDKISPQSGHYMIVHNIGQGPQMEDVLFKWIIIGHYRYAGENGRP